jgi:uncharacterized protein YndB with AHSA1/START domain
MTAMGNMDTADRDIVTTRVYDAPRERVWRAWTDPAHLTEWWGPNGFTTTVEKMDLRPGGEWIMTMHGPDGHDYPNKATFSEVKEPERLSYAHEGDAELGLEGFSSTVELKDLGNGKTELTLRATFASAAEREKQVRTVGAIEGGKQTLARFAGFLLKSSVPPLEIVRVIDAPRERVWRAWTDPADLAKWWGPDMFTTPKCELDPRPGGKILVVMHGPAGTPFDVDMPMTGEFREVAAPERVVYVSGAMPDEKGVNLFETRTTVSLEDAGGKTKLTLRVEVLRASPGAEGPLAGMAMGWGQSVERLAAHAAKG